MQPLKTLNQNLPLSHQEKARMIRAATGRFSVQEVEPGVFSVANLENGHAYRVRYDPTATPRWSCSCPDFRVRGGHCKHIWAVWLHNPPLVLAVTDLVNLLAQTDIFAPRWARVIPISHYISH